MTGRLHDPPPHAPSTQRYNVTASRRGGRWAIWAMPMQVATQPCGRQPLGNLGNLFAIAQIAQDLGALGNLGNLGMPTEVGAGRRRALRYIAI